MKKVTILPTNECVIRTS